MGKMVKATDHKGQVFESIASMCRHWNIDAHTLKARIKSGLTVGEALEGKVKDKLSKVAIDHDGKQFKTVQDMCDYWGVPMYTYYDRINNSGLSTKLALTKKTQYKDHQGNKFNSEKEMCKHWNINNGTFRDRINKGHSLKEALTIPSKELCGVRCKDHEGTVFSSVMKMCEHWGVTAAIYANRGQLKWGIGEILGQEGRGLDARIKSGEQINPLINIVKKEYDGRDNRRYYRVEIKETNEIMYLNSDQILAYK